MPARRGADRGRWHSLDEGQPVTGGPRIAVLDYGIGNLRSAEKALQHVGAAARLVTDAASVEAADAVVLPGKAVSEKFPLQNKLLWHVRRGILPQHVPPRPVVFCGIARPQNFVQQLRAANIEPAAEAFYRDHHAYREKDVRELLALKQQSEAGGFLTTEKDAINLGSHIYALHPLSVVPVKMDLQDAPNAIDTMLRLISERSRRA